LSTADSSDTPGASVGDAAPAVSRRRQLPIAALAGAAGLAGASAIAHRELLLLRPRTSLEVPLSADVEAFFFEPSETSPALVVLFVGWLLFRRRRRLARAIGHRAAPAVTAVLFAVAVGIFVWSLKTGAYDLQAIALYLEALGVAHAFGGQPALRITAVPALFLVFALPVPAPLLNELVWKFQIWTADYSGLLLHLLGQPALVSGDQILQSDRVFQIIESCSGLRTAETLAMLAVLMVDLFRRRGAHAVILLLASFPLAFVINGFRALTLIFNPHSNIAAIHNLQGIVMLLGGVLALYGLDGVLERVVSQRSAPLPDPPAGSGAAPSLRRAWLASGGIVAVLLMLSVSLDRFDLPPLRSDPPATHLGQQLDGWRGTDVEADRMFLGLANFSNILDRDYVRGGQRVNVFVGVAGLALRYRSFYTPKTALPATGWIVEEHHREQRGERAVDVLLVRKGAVRMLVHHWREGSRGLIVEALRSALGLDSSPFRRQQFPVVVRVSTPVPGGAAGRQAREEGLDELVGSLSPVLKRMAIPRGQRERRK
jgi:exosortase